MSWNGVVSTQAITQTFTRLLSSSVNNGEELRRDSPSVFANSFEYVGLSLSGSLTSSAVWSVMRITYDIRGKSVRFQFQDQISWDNRTQGWL